MAHARAITHAHAAPVVEYMTPASAVVHAAPVTTMTVAPTVLTTDTVLGVRYVDMPVVTQRQVPMVPERAEDCGGAADPVR